VANIPLPEIPELAPIPKAAPSADATQSLDSRLDQLVATEVKDPLDEPKLKFLTEDLDDDMVAAIAQGLEELRQELDGDAASRLLEKARNEGRKAIRAQRKKEKRSAKEEKRSAKEDPDGDWLVFLLAMGQRDNDQWKSAVQLYGMLRMLEHHATTPAVRQMIACHAYFGELVRVDLQRAFERIKDKAVPALIEAKKHDARKVSLWARRQLDALGRAIPGEAVSTRDPAVLADVLRAFGRIRDIDATRVVLSFATSDKVQLRSAAREALGAIGEPAEGHFKDHYKELTGENPPRSWDWKRTVREIFRLHDRARMSQVYELMDEGRRALGDKRYADAVKAFDAILARVPLFPGRETMAPAYLGLSDELRSAGKRDEALVALRKALRLSPAAADRSRIESRIALCEAQALAENGTPDRFLVERAIALDPDNDEAKKLLAQIDDTATTRQTKVTRYGAALGAGVGAILVAASVLLVRRRRTPRQA
jgi:tetratricopeptide (TPR) repeat protein